MTLCLRGIILEKYLHRSNKMRASICFSFYYKSKIKNSIYKSNIFSFKVFDLKKHIYNSKMQKKGKIPFPALIVTMFKY